VRGGGDSGQRKVHWLAWEKLLLPKCHRGTGFRDMCLSLLQNASVATGDPFLQWPLRDATEPPVVVVALNSNGFG
jgi:hypothetical protein